MRWVSSPIKYLLFSLIYTPELSPAALIRKTRSSHQKNPLSNLCQNFQTEKLQYHSGDTPTNFPVTFPKP
jgi:hypothetical protein